MGFNSAFKGLKVAIINVLRVTAWEQRSGDPARNNLTVFTTYYLGEDYVPTD